ncbi:hypothetical protein BCR41DRAFT_371703 [Lobosporangium transversale]|uniref:Uncharacterized protein n=1 Tax=Lobosporangium transversale TaxID=64571 RepID=A0A1Y2GL76_9FUNG|nr:hypothetical protein BCR41DRAFT_371703 [Lobosporangium transversale]ORZ13006.1 hypothetical protein BCR41DRAFT_371703 [Lobosporangium transversale]|eukprot:XP_021880355.1 hypothetical protein BCR41DRAFT_371703 [Lobosporangium transversale]
MSIFRNNELNISGDLTTIDAKPVFPLKADIVPFDDIIHSRTAIARRAWRKYRSSSDQCLRRWEYVAEQTCCATRESSKLYGKIFEAGYLEKISGVNRVQVKVPKLWCHCETLESHRLNAPIINGVNKRTRFVAPNSQKSSYSNRALGYRVLKLLIYKEYFASGDHETSPIATISFCHNNDRWLQQILEIACPGPPLHFCHI